MSESNRPNWYLIIGIGALVTAAGLLLRPVMRRGVSNVVTTRLQKRQRVDAQRHLAAAHSEYERWLALTQLSLAEVDSVPASIVRSHANEVLATAPKFSKDWNYGNAIHKGNLALGRLALREGKIDQAGQFLLMAGRTPGSPQLNSFGPNMLLAKELLEKGEREKVLVYFELCAKFWQSGSVQLKLWSTQVKLGSDPDFGANLLV